MHRVLELGDVRVLGDVDRGCGQAPAHLTPFLVVEIHVAVADVQETEARIVTGIELVHQVRLRGDGLDLHTITSRPVAADLGRTFEAEARRLVVVVDDVGILLRPVIPPEHGLVDLAVEGHRDLFVALARPRGFELGDALLDPRFMWLNPTKRIVLGNVPAFLYLPGPYKDFSP